MSLTEEDPDVIPEESDIISIDFTTVMTDKQQFNHQPSHLDTEQLYNNELNRANTPSEYSLHDEEVTFGDDTLISNDCDDTVTIPKTTSAMDYSGLFLMEGEKIIDKIIRQQEENIMGERICSNNSLQFESQTDLVSDQGPSQSHEGHLPISARSDSSIESLTMVSELNPLSERSPRKCLSKMNSDSNSKQSDLLAKLMHENDNARPSLYHSSSLISSDKNSGQVASTRFQESENEEDEDDQQFMSKFDDAVHRYLKATNHPEDAKEEIKSFSKISTEDEDHLQSQMNKQKHNSDSQYKSLFEALSAETRQFLLSHRSADHAGTRQLVDTNNHSVGSSRFDVSLKKKTSPTDTENISPPEDHHPSPPKSQFQKNSTKTSFQKMSSPRSFDDYFDEEERRMSESLQYKDLDPLVTEWLLSLNLPHADKYFNIFAKNEIDWDSVKLFNEQQLRHMGVTAYGPLNKMLHSIRSIKNREARQPYHTQPQVYTNRSQMSHMTTPARSRLQQIIENQQKRSNDVIPSSNSSHVTKKSQQQPLGSNPRSAFSAPSSSRSVKATPHSHPPPQTSEKFAVPHSARSAASSHASEPNFSVLADYLSQHKDSEMSPESPSPPTKATISSSMKQKLSSREPPVRDSKSSNLSHHPSVKRPHSARDRPVSSRSSRSTRKSKHPESTPRTDENDKRPHSAPRSRHRTPHGGLHFESSSQSNGAPHIQRPTSAPRQHHNSSSSYDRDYFKSPDIVRPRSTSPPRFSNNHGKLSNSKLVEIAKRDIEKVAERRKFLQKQEHEKKQNDQNVLQHSKEKRARLVSDYMNRNKDLSRKVTTKPTKGNSGTKGNGPSIRRTKKSKSEVASWDSVRMNKTAISRKQLNSNVGRGRASKPKSNSIHVPHAEPDEETLPKDESYQQPLHVPLVKIKPSQNGDVKHSQKIKDSPVIHDYEGKLSELEIKIQQLLSDHQTKSREPQTLLKCLDDLHTQFDSMQKVVAKQRGKLINSANQNAARQYDYSANQRQPQKSSTKPAIDTKRVESVEKSGQLRTDFMSNQLDIKFSEKDWIGEGAFTEVFSGKFQEQSVVIKRVKIHLISMDKTYINSEMSVLTRLHHPRLVSVLSYSTRVQLPLIVCEMMSRGSLRDLLKKSKESLDHCAYYQIGEDIFSGMTYLHQIKPLPLLHLRLTSRNILLDNSLRAKLSDPGLSRVRHEASLLARQVGAEISSSGRDGSSSSNEWSQMAWMAPELLSAKDFDTSADVYSGGVLLWEMLIRQRPYEGLSVYQTMERIKNGPSLLLPEKSPPLLRELIEKCWRPDSRKRPSAKECLLLIGHLKFSSSWQSAFEAADVSGEQMQDISAARRVISTVLGRPLSPPLAPGVPSLSGPVGVLTNPLPSQLGLEERGRLTDVIKLVKEALNIGSSTKPIDNSELDHELGRREARWDVDQDADSPIY